MPVGVRSVGFYEAPEVTGADVQEIWNALPVESRRFRIICPALFDLRPPSPDLLEFLVEDFRYWRALLLRRGLDPDRLTPEDALLLAEDKDGQLAQVERRNAAWRKLTC